MMVQSHGLSCKRDEASTPRRRRFALLGLAVLAMLWTMPAPRTQAQAPTPILLKAVNDAPTSQIAWIIPVGNLIYFEVYTGTSEGGNTRDLWASDGTLAGTVLLHHAGNDSGHTLYPAENVVYFSIVNVGDVYATQGTAATTVRIHDASINGRANDLTPSGNKLYYEAFSPATGSDLYVSEGTPATTVRIFDAPATDGVYGHVTVGNRVYFTVHETGDKDLLYVNAGSGNVLIYQEISAHIDFMTPVGSLLYFRAGGNLHVTDGTAANTIGLVNGEVTNLKVVGNQLYFANLSDLYVTGGTVASTVLVYQGPLGSTVGHVTPVGNRVYFTDSDLSAGASLYVTAGTAQTTVLLYNAPFDPTGAGLKTIDDLTPVGNLVYFRSYYLLDPRTNHVTDMQLYVTAGTADSTVLLFSALPNRTLTIEATVGGRLYFSTSATNGPGLYVTEGTAASTALVHEIPSSGSYFFFVPIGNLLYFTTFDGSSRDLYVTGGAGAAATLIFDAPAGGAVNNLTPLGNRLYFSTRNVTNGNLYVTEGTPETTSLVHEVPTGSYVSAIAPLGERLFFGVANPSIGWELWVVGPSAPPDSNAPPVIESLTVPSAPVKAGTPATFKAKVSDVNPGDALMATWIWGDGSQDAAIPVTSGQEFSRTHVYAAAGLYTVTLSVTDGHVEAPVTRTAAAYVVVYNPAPFVTGGGWINSPQGADVKNPAAQGKAHFNINLRYKKGDTAPSGNVDFRTDQFSFQASDYAWLVVTGAKAQVQGVGQISGQSGDFAFLLSVIDSKLQGKANKKEDKFRIKIWNPATGAVVYDNQMNALDVADPSTVLGGGSIAIHK